MKIVCKSYAHPDVQDVELQPDVGFIFREDLDAVDVAEIGQKGDEVGPCIDDVTDPVTWTH